MTAHPRTVTEDPLRPRRSKRLKEVNVVSGRSGQLGLPLQMNARMLRLKEKEVVLPPLIVQGLVCQMIAKAVTQTQKRRKRCQARPVVRGLPGRRVPVLSHAGQEKY